MKVKTNGTAQKLSKKISKKKRKENEPATSIKDSDLQSKNLDAFLQDWSGDDNDSNDSNDQLQPDNSGSDNEEMASASNQKKYLASLKDKDPEFHKFLEENDQDLLNFDESSSDEGENDELDPVHKLPDNLEVASDDSDYDDDGDQQDESKTSRPKVTKKMIENWSDKLENSPSVQVVSEVIMAFQAALSNIAADEDKGV